MTDGVRRWGVAYLLAAATFAALDVVWISLVAGQQYRSQIPQLMADSPNGAAAGLFYALFVCGIVAFGVRPHDPDASLASRAASGALFGLLAYATWGLTGVAVLKGFPWGLAPVSYTHLDVYKRQIWDRPALWTQTNITDGLVWVMACLLYTSRCV